MSDLNLRREAAANPIASMKGHHIAIRVSDYEAAKNWYVEKLGFRVIQEWPFGDLNLAYVAPPHDDSFYIELIGDGEVSEAPLHTEIGSSLRQGGHHHLCLNVDNVDEAIAYLAAQGVTLIGEPFEVDAIHRRLAFFADPWGNLFELAQVTE
ncbi:VOC family protein [Paenibacillus methanolicus]|uniref:Lactoylglutathione lyase/glyoxylase I family protein n=1 Tax=Paenibacillus methanolicus TaxID=582686 RepID=A0A5S5C1R6_9BACL|nr:VOC family protein [Paenibacillus methanolicus]TYP73371.1 lactoylglutathione lyase/glyoxylase I family protein [Paenibacillus methanolicus]